MYQLSVTNYDGEALSLSGNNNYTVYKVTGLNPATVSVSTASNATTDGMSINNVRVDKRNIVIYMTINGEVETNRIALYKYFPLKKPVTLYFKNGTREVYIEGYVETIECDFFTRRQVAQISLLCPQPYFKSVDELVTYFSDVSNMFSFPFSIPESGVELSAITTNVRKSIVNAGDVESGMLITLNAIGEVVNPIIYDVFNRTHIKLIFTMQSNDEITINTYAGQKSITLKRNGVITNIMGYMYPTSSWLTLAAGDNVFTYECASGANNLQITFRTAVLYGGV